MLRQALAPNQARVCGLIMKFQRLATLLTRQSPKATNNTREESLPGSPKIDSLIILDRRVDMITPFLTQLTYEGLVDELIGIKNCELSLFSNSQEIKYNSSTCRTSFISLDPANGRTF